MKVPGPFTRAPVTPLERRRCMEASMLRYLESGEYVEYEIPLTPPTPTGEQL